jgi:hypothetical protein
MREFSQWAAQVRECAGLILESIAGPAVRWLSARLERRSERGL